MNTDPPMVKQRIWQTGEDGDNIKIDREFEGLIPPLSTSELGDLHTSIDAEGDALIIW